MERKYTLRGGHKVLAVDTNVVYDSVKAASESVGCSQSVIYRAIKGGHRAKGTRWTWADGDDNSIRGHRGHPVACLEMGEEFGSITEAAKRFHVSKSAIHLAIRSGSQCRGHHFNYVYDPLPPEHFVDRKRHFVRCVETGEVFPSITEAARAKGIAVSGISTAISGKAGGFHWERIDPLALKGDGRNMADELFEGNVVSSMEIEEAN